jgi:uncharacterized protein HemY
MYKARDVAGKKVYNYVEAGTNIEAIEKLELLGHKEIELYANAFFDNKREDLSHVKPEKMHLQAQFDVEMLRHPSLWVFLVFHIKMYLSYQIFLLVNLILILVGVYFDNFLLSGFGTFLLLIKFYFMYEAYLLYDDINSMNDAYIKGNWKEVQRVVSMYKQDEVDSFSIMFDITEAKVKAIHQPKESSYDYIAQEYLYIKENFILDYYLLLFDIVVMNAQYERALESLDEILLLHPNSDTFLLSKASIFYEIDNMKEVKNIIDKIEVKPLDFMISQGLFFMLKAKLDESKELEYLRKAKERYDFKNINPAYKFQAAWIRAHYALALYKSGNTNEAKKIISKDWSILKVHIDKKLHLEIQKYFPKFK